MAAPAVMAVFAGLVVAAISVGLLASHVELDDELLRACDECADDGVEADKAGLGERLLFFFLDYMVSVLSRRVLLIEVCWIMASVCWAKLYITDCVVDVSCGGISGCLVWLVLGGAAGTATDLGQARGRGARVMGASMVYVARHRSWRSVRGARVLLHVAC